MVVTVVRLTNSATTTGPMPQLACIVFAFDLPETTSLGYVYDLDDIENDVVPNASWHGPGSVSAA